MLDRLVRSISNFFGFSGPRARFFAMLLPVIMFNGLMAHAVPSVTTLSITPSTTVNAGTVVTMTANVSNGSPVRGQVDFCLASAAYCTGNSVIASVQTTILGNAVYRSVPGAGSYSIKAVFHGTNTVASSSSAAQTLTVNGTGSYGTRTSIASSGSPGNYTLTGTVTGFGKLPPSGTVTFLNTTAANAQISSGIIDAATRSSNFTVPPSTPQAVSGGKVMKGDFNNDGILDLISTGLYSDGISIALGNGDGTFQTPVGYSAGAKPFGIGLADLNGDGNIDIVVSNYNPVQPNPGYMTVLLGNGDGTFQTAVTYNGGLNSGGVALGDFNGDGLLDAVLMNSGNIGIFIGNGDGTFQAQVTYTVPQGIPVAVGDFNGDGKLDIAVGDQNTSIGILLGNGDGTFQPVITYSAGYTAEGIVIGDFNNDGKLDIATANFDDNTMGVLLGMGDGTFPTNVSYSTGNNSQPYDIAAGDFNGDGIQDLAVSGLFGATSSHVFLGVGDGTFQASIGVDTGFYNLGITAGDFNGDGLDDFATTNYIYGSIGVELSQLAVTATATGVTVPGPGTQNVDASYEGDTPHAASLSTTIPLQPLPSSTILAASPTSAVAGTAINFTATVSPTPSGSGTAGTVSFYSGSMLLSTVNVIGASASYITTSLRAGRSPISAVYSGNSILSTSTSNPILVFVGPQSALSLTVSTATATAGTPITLTATGVNTPGSTALTPGLVTFSYQETVNGATFSGSFGTAQLSSAGVATLTIEPGAGVYAIAATFAGTATVGPSNSTSQTVTINGNASYLSSTSLVSSGSVGDYTLVATVSGFGLAVPTGTVSFLNTTNGNQNVASAAIDPSTVVQSYVSGTNSPLTNTDVEYVATGDFNGDGITDVATANTDGTVKVQIGIGNNTFQSAVSYAVSSNLNVIQVADVNGDGKVDLIVVSANDGTVSILLGNGNGTFQTPSGSHILTAGSSPDFVAIGDVNDDGNPDIVAINRNDSTAGIFLGNGDGTFQSQQTYSTGSGPNSVAIADFNRDGNLDLAVTNQYDSTISILLGNGNGTFQTQTTVGFPNGDASGVLAAGSLRNNGIIDLVAPDLYYSTIFVYLGNGDGTFGNPVSYNSSNGGVQAALTDIDHDGKLDLVAAYSSQIAIFPGIGDGTFGSEQTWSTGNGVNNVAIADFNNDGLFDFTTSNTGDNTTTILLGQQSVTATATAVYVTGTGQQAVNANYPGDTIHAASLASTVLLDPSTQAASSTLLSASPGNTSPGTLVTFTATVTPAPTGATFGSVNFYNGTTLLGTQQVNSSGTAIFTTTTLPGGANAITAVYSGNAALATSTSMVVYETVTTSTTATLSASSNNISLGQSVTLTANITPVPTGTPLGTVSFYNGTTLLGSSDLSASGIATLSVTTLPAGSNAITVVYSGNTISSTSTSSPITIVVTAIATSTALTSSGSSISYGQSVRLTANVTPVPTGTPLGTVSFYNGTTLLGSSDLSASGIATLSVTTLPAGSNAITAVYSGNTISSTSTSSPITIVVTAITTSTALTSSGSSVSYGQSVTLTANITPVPTGTPLGTVSFYSGSTLLGIQAINTQGVATLSVSTLLTGTNSVAAVYSGNANYATSTGSVQIAVHAVTTSTLTAAPTTQLAKMPIVFTFQLSSSVEGVPTGTVSFLDGPTLLGTSIVGVNGQAVYTTTVLASGVHSISANYSGDAKFLPSVAQVTTSITVADINLDLGGDQNKSVVPGGAVSYNFPLSPLVTPTFLYDVTLTASGLPPGATYTFTPASIPAGSGTTPVVLTVQTAKDVAIQATSGSLHAWFALAFGLLLPLGSSKVYRKYLHGTARLIVLFLIAALSLGVMATLSGCGNSNGFFGQPQKSYTITVTATSGNLVRTSTVQLNLQ